MAVWKRQISIMHQHITLNIYEFITEHWTLTVYIPLSNNIFYYTTAMIKPHDD